LRILEEFWKNLYVKIPHKSTCTNFQSLDKLKNPIFIPKRFSHRISAQPAQNTAPAQATVPAHSFPGCCHPRPAQQAHVLRQRPARYLPPL
jgi:hypothetical protein